jgi:hypothetical protein
MSWPRIEAESQAIQSLVQLYEQAKKCQQLYEQAHMALPEPLKRFLGIEPVGNSNHSSSRPTLQIPQPSNRKPPEGAAQDWLWVNVRHCTPSTLIAAVLRQAPEMLTKQVIARVTSLNPDIVTGSIYNAATRLETTGLIDRKDGVWQIKNQSSAPIIDNDVVWWNAQMFQVHEKAAHRRDAILYILSHFETGLEILQIVEQLQNCSWMKAPVSKDLLKVDVEVLESERKIRRRGNTRKWELAPPEKGENKTE